MAPRASPLTSCVYADDLLIFGEASLIEADLILDTLNKFVAVSGQQIVPDKSKIWYSRVVPQDLTEVISQVLQVRPSAEEGTYLGSPIQGGRQSFDLILEKFTSRLNSWKGRMLSQAGRVVLIKSVLHSLPIYFMATAKFPVLVTQAINKLVRAFFWGKEQGVRYVAYVAWEKIKRPIEEGGLAIRDLSLVNDALLMKSLWKLASRAEAQWVSLVTAKYMPRSKLWHSNRTYQCSAFWRSLMVLRDKLLPMIKWDIGKGDSCEAFGEPWFEEAVGCQPTDSIQAKLKVRDLREEGQNGWNIPLLIQLFGHVSTMKIVSAVHPPTEEGEEDRLIFLSASNGRFSVKQAYQQLTLNQSATHPSAASSSNSTTIWKLIWKRGFLQPRVRLFLWRVVQDGLPLAATLDRRINTGSLYCSVCSQRVEDPNHLLFGCDFARRCWLLGPIPIRTDRLTGSVRDNLEYLASVTSEEDWSSIGNIIWAIWRSRNAKMYQGIVPTHEQFLGFLTGIQEETRLARAMDKGKKRSEMNRNVIEGQPVHESDACCYVDGSWGGGWMGGMGYILLKGGNLLQYGASLTKVCNPLQAEAGALLEAVKQVVSFGLHSCTFFSDSLTLVQAISQYQPPLEVDWKAYKEVHQIWLAAQRNRGWVFCHIGRDLNDVADKLAKLGRIEGHRIVGYRYPIF